jgi:2-deoxy-D-gluconate 3-dehydrogenase
MKIQEKFDLAGRVAVVTGGVGLLGAEFCRTLAEAGAAVAVVDLNGSASQAVADSLTSSGYQSLAVPTDITQPDAVNAAVEKILSTFGRIDVLVNSAALDPKFDPDAINKGITPGAFEDYPLDLWNSALNVNLTGMFLMTQACVKPMIEQGRKGSIINICSTYGLMD